MSNFALKSVVVAMSLFCSSWAIADTVIGTPLLDPPSGGRVSCGIANISRTDSVEVTFSIYAFDGTETFGPITVTLQPLNNIRSAPFVGDDRTSHCVVTIPNSDKRDVRVSLMAYDSLDDVTAVVAGE